MGGYLIVQGQEVGEWVGQQLQQLYHSAGSQAIGLERDGELVAGVIYEQYNTRAIMVHVAIAGPITRSFLSAICRYPFDMCKVDKVIASITDSNPRSIRFVTKIGFREEARLRDASPDGDIVLYTITRPDCKYLGERYHGR